MLETNTFRYQVSITINDEYVDSYVNLHLEGSKFRFDLNEMDYPSSRSG